MCPLLGTMCQNFEFFKHAPSIRYNCSKQHLIYYRLSVLFMFIFFERGPISYNGQLSMARNFEFF